MTPPRKYKFFWGDIYATQCSVELFKKLHGYYGSKLEKVIKDYSFPDCLSFADLGIDPKLELNNTTMPEIGDGVWVITSHSCDGEQVCKFQNAVESFHPAIVKSVNPKRKTCKVITYFNNSETVPIKNIKFIRPRWWQRPSDGDILTKWALEVYSEDPIEYINYHYRNDKGYDLGDMVWVTIWTSIWGGFEVYVRQQGMIISKSEKTKRRNCHNPFLFSKTRKSRDYLVFIDGKSHWIDDLYLEDFVRVKEYRKV